MDGYIFFICSFFRGGLCFHWRSVLVCVCSARHWAAGGGFWAPHQGASCCSAISWGLCGLLLGRFQSFCFSALFPSVSVLWSFTFRCPFIAVVCSLVLKNVAYRRALVFTCSLCFESCLYKCGALACVRVGGRPWAGACCCCGVLATVSGTFSPPRRLQMQGPGSPTLPPPAALFVCRCPFFPIRVLWAGVGVGGEWAGANGRC